MKSLNVLQKFAHYVRTADNLGCTTAMSRFIENESRNQISLFQGSKSHNSN